MRLEQPPRPSCGFKGVEIPQDISLMPTPSAVNALTITRIRVRLPGDEEEGDQEEGGPMETETEAAGQPSSSSGSGKRSRASSSSAVPLDAFRSSLRGLMGSKISRMSNLIGWLHFKIRWPYFQQNLIPSPPSSDPLAIPIKNGEIFGGVAVEGEHAKNLISAVLLYVYVIYSFWCRVLDNCLIMGLLHTMLNILVNFLV